MVTKQIITPQVNTRPQQTNNRKPAKFEEIGTLGINQFLTIIQEAYISELRWPSVEPIYKRLWRADPEVGISRGILTALASSVEFKPVLPDNPTDDDKRAAELIESEFENMAGGIERFRDKLVATTPFFGWGWWEIVPGLRKKDWRPPDKEDNWRSTADDGLIGARRLAFRDYSSFYEWDLKEKGGVRAMRQIDSEGRIHTIPASRSVHIKFGDIDNPEGLATLEALYRLERMKYGLEVVFGIGSEHAAGHLSVQFTEGQASPDDLAKVKKAARAILMAQEGNYAVFPKGVEGQVIDVPFAAGRTIMEAIRYYGLLKLQLFNMQWVAMSTTTGTGSFAAMQDSSQMSVITFNAGMESFVAQFNDQYIKWLFEVNKAAFPNLSQRPKVAATKARKNVDLDKVANFINVFGENFDFTEADEQIIRIQSDILDESVATPETALEPKVEENENGEPTAEQEEEMEEAAQMSLGLDTVTGWVVSQVNKLRRNG